MLGQVTDRQLDFLDGGSLNAYGLGGSVMLDWEHYREKYEIDIELRYTNIHLQSFGGTTSAVTGTASAQTANLGARWRAPTGLHALDRPVRYVLELSPSRYLGSEAGILGFNSLTTVGTGLELDTSAHEVFVTRVRAVLRYVFGNNVSGCRWGWRPVSERRGLANRTGYDSSSPSRKMLITCRASKHSGMPGFISSVQ